MWTGLDHFTLVVALARTWHLRSVGECKDVRDVGYSCYALRTLSGVRSPDWTPLLCLLFSAYRLGLEYHLDFVESPLSSFSLSSSWVTAAGTWWLFSSFAALRVKSRHKRKIFQILFYLSIRHRAHTPASYILYHFKPHGLIRVASWNEPMVK